eukprot:8153283-Prorocentrum_lima.AAC.1
MRKHSYPSLRALSFYSPNTEGSGKRRSETLGNGDQHRDNDEVMTPHTATNIHNYYYYYYYYCCCYKYLLCIKIAATSPRIHAMMVVKEHDLS